MKYLTFFVGIALTIAGALSTFGIGNAPRPSLLIMGGIAVLILSFCLSLVDRIKKERSEKRDALECLQEEKEKKEMIKNNLSRHLSRIHLVWRNKKGQFESVDREGFYRLIVGEKN